MHNQKGIYLQVDGLDGVGKGTAIGAIREYELSKGKKVLDLDEYEKQHNDFPPHDELFKYDTIFASEPTYCGVGAFIRNVLINKNHNSRFSTRIMAEAFALDRRILLETTIVPALKEGKTVIQSRGVASSLVYQPIEAEKKGENLIIDDVKTIRGNMYELENAPNLLIIPTIRDPEELLKRLSARDKQDEAAYESIEFQIKFKPEYESSWLREIFERRRTRVEYIDAGISVEETKKQIVGVWKDFLKE